MSMTWRSRIPKFVMTSRGSDVILIAAVLALDLIVWNGDSQMRGGGDLPPWVIPVLATATYATLIVRWRHPVIAYLIQWSYSLLILLLPTYQPIAGLLVALYAVGRRCPRRVAITALAACMVPFGISTANVASASPPGYLLANVVINMSIWVSLAAMVWGLARSAYNGERQAEELRRAEAAAAVRAERLRLARDLHDIVSHAVTARLIQAAGARTWLPNDTEQVRRALETIEAAGVQAMRELHRLLGLLRATNPTNDREEVGKFPTLHDMDDLVAVTRASGVDVETNVDGRPARLDPSVDIAAYRIIQEALTNIVKHAGRGASARINLHWDKDALRLVVCDRDGLAPRHKKMELSTGYGLAGLAERVTLMGGRLEVGPIPDGFLVQAELPINAKLTKTGTGAAAMGDRP
jgi:signal transduction histidine kinase